MRPDARAAHRRLAPGDLLGLPVVQGVALSPDGAFVAFTVTTMSAVDDSYSGSIRVASLEHGGARTYTRGTARDGQPRWSPDGTRLLFLSDRGERRQIWFLDIGGGEPYAAPEIPGEVSAAAFSPDGRFIAAVATPNANRREIVRRGWRRIDRLRYRADGYGYLDDNPRIWLIDLAGGTVRACTDGSGNVGPPSWSPDSTHIAFAAEHRADADSLWHTELWVADVTSEISPRRACSLRGCIESPAWSRDGARLAFVGHDDPSYSLGSLRPYITAADGTSPRQAAIGDRWYCGNAILNDIEASASAAPPVFLDRADIAVLATSEGSAGVVRVRPDGSVARLTPGTHCVSEFSIAGTKVAACASTSGKPAEIYVTDIDGASFHQVTSETDGWSSDRRLRTAERFSVAGAGGPFDAWRIRASDGSPSPCILQIHGGPHAAYGESFFFEFQLLADAGYDVVYANPRGSQGYGDAFVRSIVGDWAAPAYDDCMRALDAAIAAGGIDADRLGVAGGSYGGYLTAWTISSTARFKAAIAMRPATDLESLWGTSEVGRMLEAELGARPQDDSALYRAQSPLARAEAIATPLLLIHAENDFRCPIEQSEQLFTALKRRGATVEFLRFTEGDHGLSRAGPPRLRVARLAAIVDWFDRHLARP